MAAFQRTTRIIFNGAFFVAIWLSAFSVLRAAEKAPVPSADAQKTALALVKDVYGDEYAGAKSSAEKTVFSQKLLQAAKGTNQGTANHYALLRVAWDVATQAGDAKLAMQVTNEIARVYEVNVLSAKVATVKTTDGFVRTLKQRTALATIALELADEAAAGDGYDSAQELTSIGLAASRKAQNWELVKQIVARDKEIKEAAEAHTEVQAALATLENDPTNPVANQAVGEYYCFVKGDWGKGIPMLALGTDAAMKVLARRELEIPASPSEQAGLGDGWWDLGDKHYENAKGRLRSRAAHWYRQAAPELSGLARARCEKRLGQINETDASSEERAISRATDVWIDALAAVDVSKQRVDGNWFLSDDGLALAAKGLRANRIEIPFAPRGDYDMYISFTREQGINNFGVIFPVESRQCFFRLSGDRNTVTGLWSVNGKPINVPGRLTNRERHGLHISVRQRVGTVVFTATLDGRPCFRWAGPRTALTLEGASLNSPETAGLSVTSTRGHPVSATFHEIKLKSVRGTIQKLNGP